MDGGSDNFDNWMGGFLGRSLRGFDHFIFGDVDQTTKDLEHPFWDKAKEFSKAPKELTQECETEVVENMLAIGHIVHGNSIAMAPYRMPPVGQFGKIKARGSAGPWLMVEAELLADIVISENDIKVVVDVMSAEKESTQAKEYDHMAGIPAGAEKRKYRRTAGITADTYVDTSKTICKDGNLEPTLQKVLPPKGKSIRVD